MTVSGAAAEVTASIDVRPARSQVFLVAAIILAAIAVICGAGLLALGQNGGFVFLGFATFVLVGGYWAWTRSQSDVDLHNAHPTQLTLPDGMKVTTDSRTLRSPKGVQALVQLCQEVLCRLPLPNPDGLVDSNAQVIPDSKDAALTITSKINSTTQDTTNALIDALGLTDTSPLMLLQHTDSTDRGPENPFPQNLNQRIGK